MMLGKRSRPPMKRTTSMTEFSLDLSMRLGEAAPNSPQANGNQYSISSVVSPTIHRRNSADFQLDTAHFLRACFLCKCRLISGRNIYMYRGDSAFCSLECRELQMTRDELKEKFCISSDQRVEGEGEREGGGEGKGEDSDSSPAEASGAGDSETGCSRG